MNANSKARGRIGRRVLSGLFLLPSWFAPHTILRVFFHRLRGVKIGKKVEIGYFCIIDNVHPDLITIEDGAVIATGAVILAHDNSYFYAHGTHVKHAPVVIKKKAFIGTHAVITPGVTVGERAIVGCVSVVLKDVLADSVVGGVPAKILKENGNNENPEY
jgi:acetyltransferase-like isoleucine patch superfamily enzyme